MVHIGEIYNSNNCGKFKVLKEMMVISGPKQSKDRYYLIQFLDTGYITDASGSSIQSGRVKDKYIRNIANIGYVGNVTKITDPSIIIFYKPWNDMMNRCYNVNDHDYPLYGAQGIYVDSRWHSFEQFMIDAQFLPGYENKKKYPDKYQLDKDYLQRNIPKNMRYYSRETCMWISKYDNIMLMGSESNTIYHGVLFLYNTYYARFHNKKLGRYNNIFAAANRYNHELSNYHNEFNNIKLFNDVPYMSPEEIEKYSVKPGIIYNGPLVSSTTISEMRVESK